MYLSNDSELLNEIPRINSEEEAYSFLKKSFPNLVLISEQGSYRSSVLCLFVYIGYCASTTELASLFGPFFSSTKIRNRFSELHIKKKGVLGSLSWALSDMNARTAYYITKQGYTSYLSVAVDSFKPSSGQIKVRRSKGLVPVHDYGVGVSIYSLLLACSPFYYEKEETYSAKGTMKQRGSICVDCSIYLPIKDSSTPFRIFLEQDMGTEVTATLVSKIASYHTLNLTSYASCILFSSHTIMPFSSCDTFSLVLVKKVIDAVKSNDAIGLYDLYAHYGEELEEKTLDVVCKLLVRTGIVCAYSADGGPLSAEQTDHTSELKRNMNTRYENKVAVFSTPVEDFTLKDLLRYYEDLKNGCNPYRLKLYNQEQKNIAKNKFNNICMAITLSIATGLYTKGEVLCVLGGYSCYMLPSILLSKSFSLFAPYGDFFSRCKTALDEYYPHLSFADEFKHTLYFDDYMSVILPHSYRLPDGKVVAFEHIGKDIGGFSRCYYLYLLYKEGLLSNLHIVAVCENDEDMNFFCRISGYSIDYPRFSYDEPFFLSFLMEKELTDSPCLLKGIDDPAAPVPFYIRTKKQSDNLTEFLKRLGH